MALLDSTPAISSSRITASLDVPQTQNTAPVLEFLCLYTQDLRRKQKRWQDGRLKFHTFNKRVMIYDERSNFVGDTHWRDDGDITEGEELQLDRGGILVEVGGCLGKRDQDLTELLGKRAHEREARAAAKLVNSPPITLVGPFQGVRPPATTLKPKSLNALLPLSGHYGRAMVSNISPFEERQHLERYNHSEEANRPTKRRKVNDSAQNKGGYAQNLMGATLSLGSSKPLGTASVRCDLPKPNIAWPPAPTIDLPLDDSDDRTVTAGKPSKVDHLAPEVGQTPTRRTNSRRTSLPKSGYASNPTGAALALTRPVAASANNSFKTLLTDKLSRAQQYENEAPAPKDETFIDINSLSSQPGTMVNPQDSVVEGSKAAGGRGVSNVDNWRNANALLSALNPTRSAKTPIGEISDHGPEKPTCSLRIKSRPPRRMMMLMDRFSSRPRNGPSDKTGREPNNVTKPLQFTQDPVLSQDTMRLDSFYQNQEEKLRACLNGKRKSTNLDLGDSDEQSSLIPDNGTSYQTIDPRLSWEGNDVELITQAASDPPLTKPGSVEGDTNLSGCTGDPEERNERTFSRCGLKDNRVSYGHLPLQPSSTKNAEGKLGAAAPTTIPSKQRQDCADQSSSSPVPNPIYSTSDNTRTTRRLNPMENNMDLTVKDNSSHLVCERVDRLVSDRVPCGVSTGPRPIKQKSRGVAEILSLGLNPADQTELYRDWPSDLAKPEPASSGLFVNGGLELTSKQHIAPAIKPSNDLGFQSANAFNAACLARNASVSTSDHDKVTLGNAGTVQSVEMTDDAMTNVSRGPVPALIRLSPRPVPESGSGSLREGAWSGSAGGESVTGPWSREAFDLFGLWQPPAKGKLGGGTA